ncbi:glycosyltransferase [Oxalobacteraceae bacterium]|nr:glycosyltransferase [Oxalobacteraceae bacterium]
MANQTAQLAALLRAAGASVELVQSNAPWQPGWIARWRGWRALFRLLPYLGRLWGAAGRADLLHVMANSGWSWHLCAAPAIWIARLRGKGMLLNYRGGEAQAFLAGSWLARFSLRRAHAIVVPSGFLAAIMENHGLSSRCVPNIVDLSRFSAPPQPPRGLQILVARHLEALYDNASALRAFAIVHRTMPLARLVLAGSGSELANLRQLAETLGLAQAVHFCGALEPADMADLYRASRLLLNPSRADNFPGSILEAQACGLPVVSTDVGGIPFLLRHQHNALLVKPGDSQAMASAMLKLLCEPAYGAQLAQAGLATVQQFSWQAIAPRLLAQYRAVLHRPRHSLHGLLVATLLFPLQEKLKAHSTLGRRRQLEQTQWWEPGRIRALQTERLRALLLHAGEHVPYYRTLFATRGFLPHKVNDLRDLRSLPLLSKQAIAGQRDAFRSAQAGKLLRFNTGGSSGEPLIFFLGLDRISHDVAAKWRATRWWGVDIGEPEAVLWGSPIELQRQDRWRALRDALMRTRLLPAFDLSNARLDQYLARLQQHKPRMLFGYPSALSRLAAQARARGLRMNGLGIRVAFVTAERLYPEQRALISAVFGCPVANGYGGRDAGFIAHECPEGGMHINAEDIIVEIVDALGNAVPDGDSGSIVVTHLASGDFPFVRYATGDIGAIGTHPCPCGRGLPLLQHIEGRSTDFVVAQDGTVMHGLALIYVLRDIPQIRAFKIVQETLALTRILLVCVPALETEARRQITAQFRARLGQGVEISIDEVAAIHAEASGKYRYVVSNVTPEPQRT